MWVGITQRADRETCSVKLVLCFIRRDYISITSSFYLQWYVVHNSSGYFLLQESEGVCTSCIIHQTDEIDSIFIANRFGTTYHKWNVSFLFHRWLALSVLTHLFIGFDMTSLECTRHTIGVMDNRCLISEISFASVLGPAKVWGWFQGRL